MSSRNYTSMGGREGEISSWKENGVEEPYQVTWGFWEKKEAS